jgi:glycogen phosphorylase
MRRFGFVSDEKIVAYFTMEIALRQEMFTYSGGLGVLAGDTIKSCADLNVPIMAISLLWKKGYFKQHLTVEGQQTEEYLEWDPSHYCRLLPNKFSVIIEGREVQIQAWEYIIRGLDGHNVPVYLLDTNLDHNTPEDRELTSYLYGGDRAYRLKQEMVLGIGGVRLIRALGHDIRKYHMNEGHAAFLTLELLKEFKDAQRVRDHCVFTTHTPVPAGHDQFDIGLVKSHFGDTVDHRLLDGVVEDGKLNMTLLGLKYSNYINGVAKKHGEVSQNMFPQFSIDYITNGVYSREWTCEDFQRLFNEYIPGWMNDPFSLRYALGIPAKDIWEAHVRAKKELINYINMKTHKNFDADIFTIGFARRATPYKRADLLFRDKDKLLDIIKKHGKIQIVYAGKAHPNDGGGKELIKSIFSAIKGLEGKIEIVYLPNYDVEIGKLITSGVDVWLNTPRRPNEASGTSGMKACHNGIPNLSILDGWWMEGHIENVTGWAIGGKEVGQSDDDKDAEDLYYKLGLIISLFYKERDKWIDIMTHSIAFNASFFNTHRMVHQYVLNAYFK